MNNPKPNKADRPNSYESESRAVPVARSMFHPPQRAASFQKEPKAVNHGTKIPAAAKASSRAEAQASEAMSTCAALKWRRVFAHRPSFTHTVPERPELLSPFRGFLRHCFDFTVDAGSRGGLNSFLRKSHEEKPHADEAARIAKSATNWQSWQSAAWQPFNYHVSPTAFLIASSNA